MSRLKIVNRDLQMLLFVGIIAFVAGAILDPLAGKKTPSLTLFEFLLQIAIFGLPSLLFSYHGKLRDDHETRVARTVALVIITLAVPALFLLHSPSLADGCTCCLLTLGILCLQVWQERKGRELP